MPFNKLFSFAVLILFLCVSAYGQTRTNSPETLTVAKDEKEKALLELEKKSFAELEKIVSEADALKLSENRVYIFGTAADLLWLANEKRSRALFAAAAAEIVANIAEFETDESNAPPEWNRVSGMRSNLLQKIAAHDAELALEILLQTRPSFLSQILAAERDSKQPSSNNNQAWLAQNETGLEHQFAMQAAQLAILSSQGNVQRGLELARKSLEKGVSYHVLNFAESIKARDLAAANSLADDILQKLVAADLTVDHNAQGMAQHFLWQQNNLQPQQEAAAANAPQIRYDAGKLSALAGKVADYYLRPNQSDFYSIQDILPLVEKFAPARAAALRNLQNKLKARISPEQEEWNKYSELVNKADPEQMIAAADDYTPDQKQQLYQTAANTFMADNPERAFATINLLPAGRGRDDAFNNLLWQHSTSAANEGKFAEARQIAARAVGKDKQFNLLVQLALSAAAKDKKLVAAFADEARAYINEQPETSQEMRDFLYLARVYAEIQPDKSLDMVESIVPRINEVIAASVIVLKFNQNNGGQEFREGEFILQNGASNAVLGYGWQQHLRLLINSDFERTANLADKFERNDVRILLRLTLVQSVLQERNNLRLHGRNINTINFSRIQR